MSYKTNTEYLTKSDVRRVVSDAVTKAVQLSRVEQAVVVSFQKLVLAKAVRKALITAMVEKIVADVRRNKSVALY